jgi:hypothetical protein
MKQKEPYRMTILPTGDRRIESGQVHPPHAYG